MAKKNNLSDPMTKRLDIIIRLMLEYLKRKEKMKTGEQIEILESAGLSGAEIARILGIKQTSIPAYKAYKPSKGKRRKPESQEAVASAKES